MSDAANAGANEPKPRPTRKLRSKLLVAVGLLCLVGGLTWTLIAQASSVRLYEVPSLSMSPTIQPGDRIAVRLTRGDLSIPPRRGELWIFVMPQTNLGLPSEVVKRVIGLPGETIAVQNGKVEIDGKPMEEPYLGAAINYTLPARKLGDTEYFMLGDKRNGSLDSSVFGPVPADRLIGRAIYRVWPVERAGGL